MSLRPVPSDPPADRLRFTLVLLCVAAASMGCLLALLPAAGHDQLWFLLMAQRWLDGATLYGSQVFDSNPPGIVWLSAVPVSLGRLTHLPATVFAKALVLLAEAASVALSWYFLKRARRVRTSRDPLALLFACIVLLAVLPARDFGQRDQILSFLILPYLFAAGLPLRGAPGARFAAGVMAVAGICCKPQYALIPLPVELLLLLRPARPFAAKIRFLLRPEPLLLVLGGVLYLLAIGRFTPLYFTLALPVLRRTYWAVGHLSFGSLLLEATELCALAGVTLGFFFSGKPRSETVSVLLLAGITAAAAYLLQGTGWYYQQIPALTLFGAALTLLLVDRLPQQPMFSPRWLPIVTGLLAALALGLTTHFMGYPFTQDRAFALETPDPAFFSALAPGTPVAMLTTSVDATMMPVERFQLQWAQRTNNLWLLPATLRSEHPTLGKAPIRRLSPTEQTALEVLQRRWMVEDFTRWKPQLVLVERCSDPVVHCQLLEDRHDDLLAWFKSDPAFAALWMNYRPLRSSGRFDAYVLTVK